MAVILAMALVVMKFLPDLAAIGGHSLWDGTGGLRDDWSGYVKDELSAGLGSFECFFRKSLGAAVTTFAGPFVNEK